MQRKSRVVRSTSAFAYGEGTARTTRRICSDGIDADLPKWIKYKPLCGRRCGGKNASGDS